MNLVVLGSLSSGCEEGDSQRQAYRKRDKQTYEIPQVPECTDIFLYILCQKVLRHKTSLFT